MINSKTDIVLICHNLRSCHNVGSLLRTAEGLGVQKVYLTGYTPYPLDKNDQRLPHISAKVNKQIQKTALGSDKTIKWFQQSDIFLVLGNLKKAGYEIAALEQTATSIILPKWKPSKQIALIVGRETYGVEQNVLKFCDLAVEIPMQGKKESFNVVQAAAMALYHCRFSDLTK